MLRGSHPNPGELEEPKIPPDDQAIIITQFCNPQQFSYVRLRDVMASASLVFQMEQTLVKHCTKEKNERTYLVDQKVIVLYKSRSAPKLLRGVVKKCENDDYLVWITDYGFTLFCSSLDLWPLPEDLTTCFWEIKDGGIAYIKPMDNSWTESCLRDFDNLLMNAVQLNFEVVGQGKPNRNFGKLMFKDVECEEVFEDAAEFLVNQEHAIRDTILNISLPTSEAISFELSQVNSSLYEVRHLVKNIIQLVSSFSNPFSYYPNNILRSVNHPLDELVTAEQESKRNLDKALEHRTPIHIPSSGRVMREKVFVSNESWVQSALERPSIQRNQNNEMMSDESSFLKPDPDSDYEDVQTSLSVDFWKKIQLSKRSSSPATSSEASFRTMKNANQATLSSASSDDFLSSESLKSSTESLSFKSLEESPSKGLKSASFCQKAQEKSKAVKATSTTSSATSREASFFRKNNTTQATTYNVPPDVCQNAQKKPDTKDVHDKLDHICNEAFQTKYNIPTILQNNLKNTSKTTESNKIDDGTRAMAVLAHSLQAVNPVGCLAELSFCQEVRRNMSGLNINTLLPMQQYSWPHLLNGGSLVLVNDCRTGRSWSYLPVVCSSVLGSLQSSAFSRELKLGPLAILLVDSICRAKALASICASLMASSDPPMLKVVNTHAHSLPACQMMLLNSCGILVTTPDHLLDLMGHEIAMIDPKGLEYFVFDDFDRLRQTSSQALNKVLQQLNDMPTSPTMQLILVAQQWHAREFEKLLKRMPKPLALFGNFLEAAMYGGLRLKFSLKVSSMKADLLLKFLAEQKAFKKRTLIYCTHEMELKDLHRILTTAGHECVLPSEAQNQPHQLMAVSDELEQPWTAVRNIEVLIHYSLPHSWSKFAERFRVMADRIPNYFTTTPQDEKKQPLLSYLLLDKSNSQDFIRLTEFLRAHGFETDGAPWMNCQPQADDSMPYCPYLLSTGECVVECDKRHHFILADMPPPGNPLQQEGTVIRCKLYRAYDPGHMAVWPVEYQTKGSTQWVDAPHPVNKWIAAVEMSMGTKQNVHSPCRLGDVCVIHHLGHFKRVKIVDIPPKGPVTVQLMDYGTELLRVYSSHLLQCPEQKFRTLPPLAMDIRLSGVSAGEGKRMTDTTQWIQQSLSSISDRQQMQITVDFAMLNVVYAKEVTLVEECPKMRTSVYKLLLRKELVNRGFGKVDSQSDRQLRAMHDQQKRANEEEVKGNKANIQLATKNACQPENTKTYPSPPKIEPKVFSDIHTISESKDSEPRDVAKANCVSKELHSIKDIKIDKSSEDTAPSSPEAGKNQPSTSTEALCNALMQDFCPKQDSHMFLESILEGFEATNYKKPTEQRELQLEDAPQGAAQGSSAKPVSRSLQYSTISKGAVRPRVKWSQTFSHIELTIEQQVPEYELCLESKTLIYNVSSSSPPQHFVLPLLGEVRIVSQKQHGYYLKIKLAKVDRLMDWPTLFDSVYAQKHSRWLTYDIDRADETSPPAGLVMWERYSRHHANKDDYSSEDEELYSDVREPDEEPNNSVEICEDC